MSGIDAERVRQQHRIEDVVSAAGVQLSRRGHGYMGCCPFHDDHTPSLSVAGVPGRFHCFGCGASGDVIDFIGRLHHLRFRDAVDLLDGGGASVGRGRVAVSAPVRPGRDWSTPAARVVAANAAAWAFYTSPGRVRAAEDHLARVRGIDAAAVRHVNRGTPVVGYASGSPTALTAHLFAAGFTEAELVDADLAHHSRTGHLIDTFRGRVLLAVGDHDGAVSGFIGRDITGRGGTPKYRNTAATPVFDKARMLYRPTGHRLDPAATIVVVEGPLDALAVAAAAARDGHPELWGPCTTSGTTVSTTQAQKVTALHPGPPVIALDGDPAGAEGTRRWVQALRRQHSLAVTVSLPDGSDPAQWLATGGDLTVFSRPRRTPAAGPRRSGRPPPAAAPATTPPTVEL